MFILSPSSRCSFLPCIVVETSKANTSRNKEVFMLSLIFRGYLRNAFLFNCKYQRKIMKLKVYTMLLKSHINLGKEIKRYVHTYMQLLQITRCLFPRSVTLSSFLQTGASTQTCERLLRATSSTTTTKRCYIENILMNFDPN